jgi:hypothetical protein
LDLNFPVKQQHDNISRNRLHGISSPCFAVKKNHHAF